MSRLKSAVDGIIYATVALGFVLLYVATSLVPGWLLASLYFGVLVYGLTSIAVLKNYRWSYYVIFVLAILVLALSLPQPEHYAFATNGQTVAFSIFALGGAMQAALLVLIPLYLWRTRTPRRAGQTPQAPSPDAAGDEDRPRVG